RFPEIHPLSVDERDEANRAKNDSANQVCCVEVQHVDCVQLDTGQLGRLPSIARGRLGEPPLPAFQVDRWYHRVTRFGESCAMALNLLRKKSPDHLIAEAARPERQMKRALGPFALTCIGIGAIIGTGIFALAGTAAAGEQIEASIWKTPILNF